nr:integrase, catalytic region, zinc finger, CCHC-type, peptidase aspartic, catalytic [Tanacetum cinerariifolium]
EDWLHDTHDEPDEKELEAHYMYMEKIQEVPTTDSGPTYDADPLEKVKFNDDYNVFTTDKHHSKKPEFINDTCVVESIDSNVTPGSSDMCDNEGQADQNAEEHEDERVMLTSLIANFKLDLDENKSHKGNLRKQTRLSLKSLRKANKISKNPNKILRKANKILDLVQGNITIKRAYCTKGLNHNLFWVGQFYDADMEDAFRKSTCFVRDIQGSDLLTGNCGSDLYTISLQETSSPNPICFMAKASPNQA